MNSSLSQLPTIAQTIRNCGLITKKSLGQHFLTDASLLDKIVSSAGDLSEFTVLEIGPGPGGLTRSIIKSPAKKIIVIEKDKRCIPVLNQLAEHSNERMEVVEDDALQIDIGKIAANQKIKIISNLPYNISTELLAMWLNQTQHIENMTLMFQKEVAERIVSQPGSKQYGRLSVLCQWLCKARILFDVSPQAFTPPPKVESSILSITPLPAPLFTADKATLEKVTKATFGQRRKTIRASLRQITDSPEVLIKEAGLDEMARPEDLTVAQFCALARAYDRYKK